MITTTDLKNYLTQLGVTVPDFMLQAMVNKANATEACLIGAGVSEDDITLILMYSAAVLAMQAQGRQITSQSAPSGASQSYKYGDTLNGLKAQIRALDTTGCTSALLTGGSGNFFMVLK